MAIFRWLKASNCKTRNVATLTCSVSLNLICLPWFGFPSRGTRECHSKRVQATRWPSDAEENSIESLLSYFLLLCVLLLRLLSRSRGPTMGFHSPIQILLRRSISAQRKSDLRAHFSSSGRRLGTRSDVVTTRGWKVWMSRREVIEPEDTFRSTNQRSIQLLTDQSTAN